MRVVDYLLDIIKDWNKILNQRHVKFVEAYEQYKRQLKMVSAVYNYNETETLCIFWRIQRQLFVEYINRSSNGLIKAAYEVPEKFDDFLLWSLKQYRDDAEKVFEFIKKKTRQEFNINILSELKKQKIESILKTLNMFEGLQLPENIKPIFEDLKDGQVFTEVAKKHERSVDYLIRSIIGRTNPRYNSERGWLAYISDEVKLEKREIKVLEFPKGSR
jgi:hypothetical protein